MPTPTVNLRENQVLAFMNSFLGDNQRLPYMREISERFGWKAEGTARNVMKGLIKKGLVRKATQRALQLIHPHDHANTKSGSEAAPGGKEGRHNRKAS